MVLRSLLSAACAAAFLSVPGALAPSLLAPNALANESDAVKAHINDHTIDPVMVAMRRAVETLVRSGGVSKAEAEAVAHYYARRGYEPAWTADGELTERGQALAQHLREAHTDGLDPRQYPTPPDHGFLDLTSLARADVMLSRSAVTYARHAYGGQLTPSKVSRSFDYQPNEVDPAEVISHVVSADNPAAALDSYNPQHPEFQGLRTRLAEVRADEAERPPFVPPGRLMKLGSRSDRVAILRERLDLLDGVENPKFFDEALDEAVRAYQEASNLTVDGIVGPGTLGSLNRAAVDHEATILANMERWRWMPKDLGRLYVRVNVPNFNLDIYRDGEVFHTTRIVVGKPRHATPIFSDEIEHVVVNPTWNVPASIARNEILPTLQRSRGNVRGYNIYANINGRYRRVDPTRINWSRVDMRRIQIKQPPGSRNALGQVKFMFPNRHSVYLHDTPSKSLFEKDYRAYSHGCMRVHNPWDFAEALLEADPNISGEMMRKKVGGREQQMNLEEHIPVHVTYFTAWVDDDGELQIRGDVYGHDKRVQQALGLS